MLLDLILMMDVILRITTPRDVWENLVLMYLELGKTSSLTRAALDVIDIKKNPKSTSP